ncbi:MAG: RHS repeat-associated core domain-containing protein, partial [Methylococcaceae bacterium]|nr:RHS repeat-associated core domain-containing protein [Methylococcaceae bacterium]
GSQTSYGYDNADRLTGLSHTTSGNATLSSYAYTLDAGGNRTKAVATESKLPEKLINNSQTYTYNPQKNRLTSQNGTALSYDQEGQLLTQGSTTYAFDYAHRLISQGTSSYVYDGIGNRIKAIRNGQITKYVYDAAGNLLAEANQANQITKYYIYGKGLTALVDATSNQLYVYHFDGTGHTVALTNASQQTQNTYAYDPYGKLMAQTEAIQQPFKYAGQVGIQAEGNNLYDMRARYYDANLGRFISEDPAGFIDGTNLYAYVGGNPIMLVDPSGLAASEGAGRLNRVSVGATLLPFTNAMVVVYDHSAGFFPTSLAQVEVSNTALGAGLSFSFDTGLQASKVPPGQELGFQLGQSRYLSFGTNSALNSFDVNLGVGIALPGIGFSKVIQEALP